MSSDRGKILLVDDRSEQRLAVRVVLDELGAEVVEASSGREALRCLLDDEFAVILLDVNMPGMDGFETATLIRERKRSEHTPIIFVTAFADDTHPGRGYSLGAVDYILTPVIPEVLRTKVAVLIDLYNKTAEVRRQADTLRQRATQLHRLTEASLSINSAESIDRVLDIATRTAAAVLGANQAAGTLCIERDGVRVTEISTFSAAHGMRRTRDTTGDHALAPLLRDGRRSLRMSQMQIAAQSDQSPLPHPLNSDLPLRGWLAARLTGRDGRTMGLLELSDKVEDDFSEDDESILVQLAQIVSIAVENTLYKQASEANRIKDEFLSTLSHELRTPLQAMLTWTRVLRQPDLEAAVRTRGLDVLERSVKSQQQLIDDLLDVSRVIAGKLRLETGPFDLARVIDTAIDAIRPLAAEKHVHLDGRLPRQCRMTGDAVRLQQVIANLLSNAVRFTPADGRVEIDLEEFKDRVRIQVRDTGKGISPDFLPHLFERFRQADSSTTRAHGGLGLGLAIVRHLVELHGGSVGAESDGDGQGATFTVYLPRTPPLPSADPTMMCADSGDTKATPANNGFRLDGISIVLVDDEADTRDCLTLMLQQLGASVTTVACAGDALAVIDRGVADLLVSDLGMPGEDGYSLIGKIRARSPERGGRIPAAALTAYVRPEERIRALAAGFDAHIEKPVEPEVLANILHRLARRGRDGVIPFPHSDHPKSGRSGHS